MKTITNQPIMDKTIETDKILQYTITNIIVDWDMTGISKDEYNEMNYKLGVGKGWVFRNGKIYINSSEFGKDDEFVQLVFINDRNQTLDEIHDDFEPFTPDSGVLFHMFGLVVEGYRIQPLSNEMVKPIYDNLINIEFLIDL